jgi:hypothetical protein
MSISTGQAPGFISRDFDKKSDASTIDYLNGPGVDNKIWQKVRRNISSARIISAVRPR